jgi:hypothetical protein
MNSESEKAARERRIFHDFIPRSGLAIDPESVESRAPPEPDILCFCQDDGLLAFELVEICDPKIARTVAVIRRNAGDRFLRSSDSSEITLQQKINRRYETKHPIELLCYTAGRTLSPDSVILPHLKCVLDQQGGKFRRVWLSGDQRHLVWSRI